MKSFIPSSLSLRRSWIGTVAVLAGLAAIGSGAQILLNTSQDHSAAVRASTPTAPVHDPGAAAARDTGNVIPSVFDPTPPVFDPGTGGWTAIHVLPRPLLRPFHRPDAAGV